MTFEAERAPGGSSEGDVGCTYVATKLKWRIRAGELRIGKANMSWRTLYDVPKNITSTGSTVVKTAHHQSHF